ncbi:MAG TPA: hypothetical protein VGX71_28025 [Pseudaminobacter sp.]|nr:hypothetical protein [Pseudaminobacter sp.]
MTDFRMTLKVEASDIAFAEVRRAGELKRRAAALDEEIAKVQAELDQAEKASARIGTYRPMIGDTFQCPVCWIKRSEQSPLVPRSSGFEDELYQCVMRPRSEPRNIE